MLLPLRPKILGVLFEAVVANTFVSFNCMEKMPIILRALNPNGKVKVVTKDRKTISRHVHQYAEEIRDDIYSIVQFLKSNGTRNFPMTNDLWTNRNVETFCVILLKISISTICAFRNL